MGQHAEHSMNLESFRKFVKLARRTEQLMAAVDKDFIKDLQNAYEDPVTAIKITKPEGNPYGTSRNIF